MTRYALLDHDYADVMLHFDSDLDIETLRQRFVEDTQGDMEGEEPQEAFCRWLMQENDVIKVPVTSIYMYDIEYIEED